MYCSGLNHRGRRQWRIGPDIAVVGGERGGRDLYCDGSLKGPPVLAALAGAAQLRATYRHFQRVNTVVLRTQTAVITQIIHGMPGHYCIG